MNCQQTPGGLLVTGITDFSLPETLDCGQCFRWQRLESGAYRGSAYGKSLTVSMDEKGLLLQGAAEEDFQALWRSYFDALILTLILIITKSEELWQTRIRF